MKESSYRFWICAALVAAVLLTYAQTFAFSWDEGFHLLAAQLIDSGKTPYLDFAHAQTPYNAYWNATWMRVLGENWRGIHVVAALLTVLSVVLMARFFRSRWPEQEAWGPIVVLVLAGLNPIMVEFGTIGQAYALGLALIACAFVFTVESLRRSRTLFAGLAGFCSGAAAASTLLTAPAAPVLLLWLFVCSRPGTKLARSVVFVGGAGLSLIPLLALFLRSPEVVIFDMFRYHMFYRRSDWPGATQHDLELFASWIDSPQAILLTLLAVTGIWFVAKRSTWKQDVRREFYLCGWLPLALGAYTSTAHPTFMQYYIFSLPFLAVLASIGLSQISARLDLRTGNTLAAAVCVFVCLELAKDVYDKREDYSWLSMGAVAQKADEVTPRGGSLYADEHTYFLTKRTPPPGNEYISSHKLRLAGGLSERLHIVPQPEWDRRISAGEFDAVETCEDQDWIKERKLNEIYSSSQGLNDCAIFWGRRQK